MVLSLFSCGSGGGSGGVAGGSSNLPAGSKSVGTGGVAILLTDDYSDDFSAVNITITKIELLSDDGRVTVYSGEKTVNLLDLKNETTVFSIEDNVPAGEYNKIRLTAEKVELVDKELVDDNGDPVTYPVKLPGNNKVDLNPREPFTVTEGELIGIHLDMDAEKCIHIVGPKNEKKSKNIYQFRPVVFIKIIKDIQLDDLVRASGIVRDIDFADNQFTLCMIEEIDGIDNDDGNDDRCCITVSVSPDTSFFDAVANGRAVDFEDLMVRDEVTAIGFYRTRSSSMDDSDDSCHMMLDASVVEIGAFSKFKGEIFKDPDFPDELRFRFDPGQGFGTGTEVKLLIQGETKVYSVALGAFIDDWTEEDILDKSSEIDGILLLSDSNPDSLVAAFILIDETVPPSERLSGEIDNINGRDGTFDLVLSSSDTICVEVPEDADIFLISEFRSSEMIDFTGLYNGLTVDLYEDPDHSGADCFVPKTIIAFESG
jgi:hypothetical protein